MMKAMRTCTIQSVLLLLLHFLGSVILGVSSKHPVCFYVYVPSGKNAGINRRAALSTWANVNATYGASVFIRMEPRRAEYHEDVALHPELTSLRAWSEMFPEHCMWMVKVLSGSYVNIVGIIKRLECLTTVPALQYLGVRTVMQTGNVVTFIGDNQAGIVLRREVVKAWPKWFQYCLSKEGFAGVARTVDTGLGLCLWLNGIELHAWLDEGDDVVFDSASTTIPHPLTLARRHETPYGRLLDEFVSKRGISRLQCVLIAANISASKMTAIHTLMGKSRRWHKNIACVSRAFMYPELTSAIVRLGGKDVKKPVISPVVRSAIQQCFLEKALAVGRTSVYFGSLAPQIRTTADLVQEWMSPQLSSSPVTSTLRKGHFLCIAVLATQASQRYIDDAAAILETWASRRSLSVLDQYWAGDHDANPGSVEAFLVGMDLPGPDDQVLRLSGDVDMGFLFNSVRTMYLWRYLGKHHVNDCEWFAKVDADTFLNVVSLKERLWRYFNASEPHYLGAIKESQLASNRRLGFASNAEIFSQELLRQLDAKITTCFDALVFRKLGEGAEDIDLAYCVDHQLNYQVQRLGAGQEMMSSGLAKASSDTILPSITGACMLMQHPIHSQEMRTMHGELKRLLGTGEVPLAYQTPINNTVWNGPARSRGKGRCDWPEKVHLDRDMWRKRMIDAEGGARTDCWMEEFNWRTERFRGRAAIPVGGPGAIQIVGMTSTYTTGAALMPSRPLPLWKLSRRM